MQLTSHDRAQLDGRDGLAAQMAMRIMCEAARMLGADRLIDIASAHIDSCLYHGDSGVTFAERLVADDGAVRVPATLNVGALDLLHRDAVHLPAHEFNMAERMMAAYRSLGCKPTWTCAPYQAGHRPELGQDVAWGESNAVVFCNSVLGARTNRYGDFLDICAALTGRAPHVGLHITSNRYATVLIDASKLENDLVNSEIFYPVVGRWLGRTVGDAVAAFDGFPTAITEDRLKALGAAAAAIGSVALFHVIGTTPEAPNREAVFGGLAPVAVFELTRESLEIERQALSTIAAESDSHIDAVAIGSPHASQQECELLAILLEGRKCRVPFYCCTGRHVIPGLAGSGALEQLERAGVQLVADTCIVVTPILPSTGGILLTNSGKFAHYATSNIGYDVVYGSLRECVDSAVAGRFVRSQAPWQ